MTSLLQNVTGPEFLRLIENSCAVLESAAGEAHTSFAYLSADLQRRIERDLRIVFAVTDYLGRHVMPRLAEDHEFQRLLTQPHSKRLIARFTECAEKVCLKLKPEMVRLN